MLSVILRQGLSCSSTSRIVRGCAPLVQCKASIHRHLDNRPPCPRALSTLPGPNESTAVHINYDSIAATAAHYLENFHNTISFDILPWSATIPLAALSLRLLTFPLFYYTQIHYSRAAIATTEVPRIHHFVRNTPGSLYQKYITFRRLRNLTLRAAGTGPMYQLPWNAMVQIPVVIMTSMGLRMLAMRALPEWQTGGLFFAPNLLAADPSNILPLMTTALWLWNTDPRMDTRRRAETAMQQKTTQRSRLVDAMMTRISDGFTTVLQVVAVSSLLVTTQLPAGIVLLWASNGVITATQRWALSRDGVRRTLGLPTKGDISSIQQSNLMPAIEQGVEQVRKELSYIQSRMLEMFPNRAVDDRLCADVNRLLKRERFSGRISGDLEAVIREDDSSGRAYVAVVRKGSHNADYSR